MRILELPEIRQALIHHSEVIDRMRDALIAQSRGECDTPMPMHLAIGGAAEVHIKSSYRRGGKYFVLKAAGTFPQNAARGLPTGHGMMLLSSAESGEPLALLCDAGHLTDVRTAAVAAMTARELGRTDRTLGILGTGIQARLQARLHAEVLPLERIWLWGRTPERAAECARELADVAEVVIASTPAEVALRTRLIVTATMSRVPLLDEVAAGTHISAVGSDSAGKQELSPAILDSASLVLVDSRRQCEKLGELQHAGADCGRVMEIGEYCESGVRPECFGITVADFTGLGVEDLYIAEYCYERIAA